VPIKQDDVLDRLKAVEADILNYAEDVSAALQAASREIRRLREGDSDQIRELQAYKDKYLSLRELLK